MAVAASVEATGAAEVASATVVAAEVEVEVCSCCCPDSLCCVPEFYRSS